MKKLIFKTSQRKRLHFTFDDKNPICSAKHKYKISLVNTGTPKESNCKNCVRIWKSIKKKGRKEFLKSIGKI